MLRGQTIRVETLAGRVVTFGSGARYEVGPAKGGHELHPGLASGHLLIVVKDSAPNGDTLVTPPCQSDLLLLAKSN